MCAQTLRHELFKEASMVNITPSVTCTRNGTTITCSLTHDQGATWTTVQRQGAAQFLVNQGTPLPGSCSETVSKGTYKYILTDSVGHHSDSQATNFITANCPKSANSFLTI